MRNQATLIVAILALVGSVCALYFDNQHLELQQTQHEEAMELGHSTLAADTQHAEFTRLSFHWENLRDRLNDQLEWLNEIPDNVDLSSAQRHHKDAYDNWCEADKKLLAGNFDRVQELIDATHASLEKCYSAAEEEAGRLPLPPRPVWIEPGEVK